MNLNNLFAVLAAHPTLACLLFLWIVAVLHVPFRYQRRRDRHGREYAIWRSPMFTYSVGPRHERLDYDGMRRLQGSIHGLLCDAWALLRGDLLRRFVAELRQRFGL